MARPFADVLRELSGGEAYDQATDKLAEVVEAVVQHRKAGEFSLILKITPNADSVIVTETIKAKIPEATRGATVFFVTSGGALVRQDPRQQDLPLRTVAAATPASAEVQHG
jgi:acetyl esterase/lipase